MLIIFGLDFNSGTKLSADGPDDESYYFIAKEIIFVLIEATTSSVKLIINDH